MDVMIKAAAIALISAVAALSIRKYNPEMAYVSGVACAILISIAAVSMLAAVKDFLEGIISSTGISSVIFLPAIKCTAIAVISKIVSGFSKDAGQTGVASAVEYLGAAAAILTVIPLMSSVLKTIEDLL